MVLGSRMAEFTLPKEHCHNVSLATASLEKELCCVDGARLVEGEQSR